MADKRAPTPMSEGDLATRLEQMNRQSIGHLSDEVTKDQDENLERYFGLPYGDEEDGRSHAISMDVAEVVDWAIPDILEPFISGERVVEFTPESKADEEYCERAADLVNHAFWNENNGVMFLHDVVKTAAIQKIGFAKTLWQTTERETRETMSGLPLALVEELKQDASIEIESVDGEPLPQELADPDAQAAYSDGQSYTVAIVRKRTVGRNTLIAVPPEEVKFSPRATSLEDIDYICHETETTRAKLVEMGFDQDIVDGIGSPGRNSDMSRDDVRFHDEGRREDNSAHRAGDILRLVEEYPLIDANNDGRLERLQVFRVGKTILQMEEVDEHPFDAWSPDRVPHRLVGLAIADKVKATAYVKTHLTRQLLDNVYLANNPRMEVPEAALGEDTIADLLTYRVGGLIRTKGQGSMLRPIEIPDRSATALSAILYMDGVREQQSGITRNGMAVSSEQIDPKSATESRRQDRNEQVRKRLMCRMLAETFLVPVFKKILRNIVRYQDAAKEIKIRGEWVAIDPRGWNSELPARVSVGLGHANRDELLAGVSAIGEAQNVLQQFGIVEPRHVFKMASKLVEAVGFKFAADYFLDPTSEEGQQAMAARAQNAPQDPRLIEARGKMELSNAQAQHAAQLAEQKQAVEQSMHERKLLAEREMEQLRAASEREIAELRIGAERDIAERRLAAETELELLKVNLARAAPNGHGDGISSGRMGGDIG
ncbi:MAG: portal protein [Hyphomicrobium sp.]